MMISILEIEKSSPKLVFKETNSILYRDYLSILVIEQLPSI
jgi:hypothetical protein